MVYQWASRTMRLGSPVVPARLKAKEVKSEPDLVELSSLMGIVRLI